MTRTRVTGTLRIELLSPLSVGGYTAAPAFVDSASALGSRGEPLIPASTVRGALREALTRLVRGRDDIACSVDAPCGGEPCVVCRIFGGAGPDRPAIAAPGDAPIREGRAGGLRLSDARHPTVVPPTLRAGVGIDRARRAAAPEVLFDRQVVDRPGLVLEAPFEAELTESDFELLQEASALVSGLGNSRTRGYGEIRLSWQVGSRVADTSRSVEPGAVPADSILVLEIEALEPLVLGGIPTTGSLERSLGHIRGSALRGAIATALVRTGVDPGSSAFQRLFVNEATCLRFSDAGPCASGGSSRPRALSLLRCRRAGEPDHHRGHGSELDQLLWSAVTEPLLQGGGAIEAARCAICGALMKSAGPGWDDDPARELVTRLARDVHTGSAMPGMLYTTERIEPGARFAGTVAGVDDDALDLLRNLPPRSVRVGHGRNRGQGSVSIAFKMNETVANPHHLGARRKQMIRQLAGWLEAAACFDERPSVERWVPILARTDLRLPPRYASKRLADILGGNARCRAAFQARGQRSGWDLESGTTRPLAPVVIAGSAWLFELDEKPDLDALARIEREGVGEDRHLGCGQIELFSSVFTKGVES